ncbi:hypothetical protein ACQPZX_24800 [Actinoplanes sp. CA-142083]|uniref:hypothetical protein n=1 Tax=Actinoplanes sp. CA-142083 TaxID=3239903 RepID=UPI003D8BB141
MDPHRVGATLGLATAMLLVIAAVVVVYRFLRLCLVDLERAPVVAVLPREAWRLLILFLIPLGGLLYWRFGRPR